MPDDVDRPRSMPEWVILLALIALLVAVAWSQFGPSFDEPVEGRTGPRVMEVERAPSATDP